MKTLLILLTVFGSLGVDTQHITFPQSLRHTLPAMFDYNPGMINEFGTTQNLAYFVANLGLKTLRDLLTKQNNVIISPLNIYSCLDLLSFGAVGKTKEEVLDK